MAANGAITRLQAWSRPPSSPHAAATRAAGSDALQPGARHDVVHGVEARIADAGLRADGHEAAPGAAVEHVAQVQVAVEQHRCCLCVRQPLAPPDCPVPRGGIHPRADRGLGQASADPGEGLLAPPAQHARRRRRGGDPLQGGEQLRPLFRKRGGRHVLRRCPGHDLLQHHRARFLVDGQHGGHPARGGEPPQHAGLLGQEGPLRTDLQHRGRAVGPAAPQRDQRGAVREGPAERESTPGRQPRDEIRRADEL